VLFGAEGLEVGLAKLPGVALVLAAAFLFALGAVLTKRQPLAMPPMAIVAWQVGVGSLPLLALAFATERPDFAALSAAGWAAMAYMAVFPLCISYLTWFAALRRLPAAAASIGTLLTPVVGVLSAAAALGEPLGWREIAALALTVGGVVLAVRG
jgi:drug/metabolite transporter (DMT)-like permease